MLPGKVLSNLAASQVAQGRVHYGNALASLFLGVVLLIFERFPTPLLIAQRASLHCVRGP